MGAAGRQRAHAVALSGVLRALALLALPALAVGATRWEADPDVSRQVSAAREFVSKDGSGVRLVRAFEAAPKLLLGDGGGVLELVTNARKLGLRKPPPEARVEEVVDAVYDRLRDVGELHLALDRGVATVVVSRKRVDFEWPDGARMVFAVRGSLWVRERGRAGRLPWSFLVRRTNGRLVAVAPTGDRIVLKRLKAARKTGPLNERQRKLAALEVQPILRRMYDGAVARWRSEKRFPESAGPVPAKATKCRKRRPVAVKATASEMPLGEGKLYFQYSFEATPKGFTARATGDLDCDGTRSTFEYVGVVGDDGRIDAQGGLKQRRPLE